MKINCDLCDGEIDTLIDNESLRRDMLLAICEECAVAGVYMEEQIEIMALVQ